MAFLALAVICLLAMAAQHHMLLEVVLILSAIAVVASCATGGVKP